MLRGEELLPAEVPLPPPPVLQVLLPASQELLCGVLLLGALCARRLALRVLRLPAPCALRRLGPGLRLHLVLRGEELLPAEVPLPSPQELLCGVLLLGALLRSGHLRSGRLCSLLWLRRDCSGGDAGCGSSGSHGSGPDGPEGAGSSDAEGLRTTTTRTSFESFPRQRRRESFGSGVRARGASPVGSQNSSPLKPSRTRHGSGSSFALTVSARGRSKKLTES